MAEAPADRPFVDRPPGSTDDVVALAAEAATRWGLPTPELQRVSMNALLTAGDVVLRVGRPNGPPEVALELARVLRGAGVRVPAPARDDVVTDGALAVTAWERLVPTATEPDWADVGRMVAIVHDLDRAELPAGVPLPRPESFPWWHFDELLDEVGGELDAAARDGIERTVERTRGWAEGVDRVVCHGDVHPGNVVSTAAGPVLLDWDLLCWGPAAWDHAMLLRLERWGWPGRWYDEFAAGYGRSLAGDWTAEALADLRLVAATLMRLRAGRQDPAAMPEARLRLARWRNTPDPPPWTAV